MSLESAWGRAEETTFGFFMSVLGSSYDKNAFIGETPKDFAIDNVDYMWMWEINGGAQPVDFEFNTDTPGGCGEWRMNGKLQGVFKKRTAAQLFAGMIRQAVPPLEGSLEGITYLRPTGEPMITRDVVEAASDQTQNNTGGDIRVWALVYPFEIVFTGVEA